MLKNKGLSFAFVIILVFFGTFFITSQSLAGDPKLYKILRDNDVITQAQFDWASNETNMKSLYIGYDFDPLVLRIGHFGEAGGWKILIALNT